MGRTARGVRGISLRGDDYVTGVAIVDNDKKLITVTENGFGKRTDFDDFRVMKKRRFFPSFYQESKGKNTLQKKGTVNE